MVRTIRLRNPNWRQVLQVFFFYFQNFMRNLYFIKIIFVTAIPAAKQPEKKQDIGKEAAIEAEVRAARERALVPLETRVKSFKEMLKEKDVSFIILFYINILVESYVIGFNGYKKNSHKFTPFKVSAFSTWEKELHKIVFDPRYLLLTSRERKQVFEKYVKERAEEERHEKRHKIRQKKDDFRALMEAANMHGK